jgi:hypothetical protein
LEVAGVNIGSPLDDLVAAAISAKAGASNRDITSSRFRPQSARVA